MTLEIPAWVLWTVGLVFGVPAVVFIGLCTMIGITFLARFKKH